MKLPWRRGDDEAKRARDKKRLALLQVARDNGFLEGWKSGGDLSTYRLQKILDGQHDLEIEELRNRILVLESQLERHKNGHHKHE